VTGVVEALGISTPRLDDRIRPASSNPEHYESHSIMLHSEDVLDRLGGSLDSPPDLQPGWIGSPELVGIPDPAPVISNAYPAPGPLVWKDPRVCLLLPYWRPLIPEPVAAVFTWRSPLAVARSLRSRDELSLVHGLSLWERYNREALEGLRGMDVFVLDYQALMSDPRSTVSLLTDWLGSLAQFAQGSDQWDVSRATSVISEEFQHQSIDPGTDQSLLPEHRSMIKLLSSLEGAHRRFDPGPLPEESAWGRDVLRSRREARLGDRRESELWERVAEQVHRVELAEAELAAVKDAFESTRQRLESTLEDLQRTVRVVDTMQASASWRATRPLRSLSAKAREWNSARSR
jgi:hypothetical protein